MHTIITINQEIKIVPHKMILSVYGPFGCNEIEVISGIKLELDNHRLKIININKHKVTKAHYGLFISLLKNSIVGVINKFFKVLKVSGSGYKFLIIKNCLVLHVGKTKASSFIIPANLSVELVDPTRITISSINKDSVGKFASIIRNVRPIEPYKLRGISYLDEIILKKEGKKRK